MSKGKAVDAKLISECNHVHYTILQKCCCFVILETMTGLEKIFLCTCSRQPYQKVTSQIKNAWRKSVRYKIIIVVVYVKWYPLWCKLHVFYTSKCCLMALSEMY